MCTAEQKRTVTQSPFLPTGDAANRQNRAGEPERRPDEPQEPLTGDRSGFSCLNARESPPETLSCVRKQPSDVAKDLWNHHSFIKPAKTLKIFCNLA